MFAVAKITAKGQTTIPQNVRAALHVSAGDLIAWDPFAGGGALRLEAQRLRLESNASDLNPAAVLINKATIKTLCERQKRAVDAMAYNALVQSWPEITRLTREAPMAAPPASGNLFDEEWGPS